MANLDVDFIGDFIRDVISGENLAEVKNLIYRDGGLEISPGNIVPCLIPDRLVDHKRTIVIDGEEKEVTIKGVLNDGDTVVVGTYSGLDKYIILEKINV